MAGKRTTHCLFLLLLAAFCGSGCDPGQLALWIVPQRATVSLGQTRKFSAVVVPSTESVSWSVAEGDAWGTITQDGLYTAPAALPDPPAATVRVTVKESGAVVKAQVTIVDPTSTTTTVPAGATTTTPLGTTTTTAVPDTGPISSGIPRGERIFFVRRHMVMDLPMWDVYSMGPDGGDVRRHTSVTEDAFTAEAPEISRDGSMLTFVSNYESWLSAFYTDIFVWDLNAGSAYRLSGDQRPFPATKLEQLSLNIYYPEDYVLSSSQIMVSYKGCSGFVNPTRVLPATGGVVTDTAVLMVPADEDIWVKAVIASGKGDVQFVRVQSGSPETVNLDLRNGTLQAGFPGPSPDGEQIACVIVSAGPDLSCNKIALYNADGSIVYDDNVGGPTRCGDLTPAYSPDGTKIAYCPGQPGTSGLGILSALDPEAPPTMLITSDWTNGYPICSGPTWSPDGSWIVFTITYMNGLDLTGNIYRISSAGGEPEQLTFYSGNVMAAKASYSPDGSEIAFGVFTSDSPGSFQLGSDYSCDIYVMPAAGGTPDRLTNDGVSKDPSWGVIPD